MKGLKWIVFFTEAIVDSLMCCTTECALCLQSSTNLRWVEPPAMWSFARIVGIVQDTIMADEERAGACGFVGDAEALEWGHHTFCKWAQGSVHRHSIGW